MRCVTAVRGAKPYVGGQTDAEESASEAGFAERMAGMPAQRAARTRSGNTRPPSLAPATPDWTVKHTMMRLIIPLVFALVGAGALVVTHDFEDHHAAHGSAFIALLAASHAAATADQATPAQTSGAVAAVPQRPAGR